ncbi:MAG: hypothetical protein JWO87_3772 [Phycisphaerales bacterium]|jgi:hypothetical protein|nr:hypothetical protein [Phycisphaerales bacterium]MDB5302109.1 hypothetical protein [Phycisphaerales bacterium]MDB5304004.1 hypothetical protein [Phycisphaerales bacterium]
MNYSVRSTAIFVLLGAAMLAVGCEQKPPYGSESQLYLPAQKRQVWAIAPAINLSGQKDVDPLLQADLLYQQLQQVHGLTVVPVNRVVEVYAGLRLEKVQTPEQAAIVCDLLGCDALVVPTVTAYDPYDPPKIGASLQVFHKPRNYSRPDNVDVRGLSRSATPGANESLPPPEARFLQAVGIFDAANGTTRDAVLEYAKGRHDPVGPMGAKEYLVSMDRYGGFVYHSLTADVLRQIEAREKKI